MEAALDDDGLQYGIMLLVLSFNKDDQFYVQRVTDNW